MNFDAEIRRIQKMLDEIEVSSSEDEEIVGGDVPASDSEGEEDYLEEDVHVPDSDCYESDPDDLPDQPQKKKPKIDGWKGKDKTTWWKKNVPKLQGRTRSSNVIKFTPGLKGPALNANLPAGFWGVFITPEIYGLLVKHTNSMIAMQKAKYAQPYRTKDTDVIEMKALIGLLMFAGTYHASRLHLADIWKADGTGIKVFRLTMSLDRFRFLLCCVRFDDKATREERKRVDELGPVRQIFEMFEENCKKNYTPSEFVTIDEMLVAFRGHCPFRQYIPSKPAKYIKIHQNTCTV
ncbi:piggyBac transposable element-derived protein 4-like [Palaemon carinicauda]|uniref:piggyBac transposable element-derived protein 4-like n=1 Tax=Palaemon carinicauda TaxID=392227 RepID=UPI0035B5A012